MRTKMLKTNLPVLFAVIGILALLGIGIPTRQ
jgi:hypothetical protein